MFDGKVEHVRFRNTENGDMTEVDRNYGALPFVISISVHKEIPKCAHFDKMVELAERLAAKFSFVRVDFLYTQGKIYFSELTFTPTAGRVKYTPEEYNLIFGDKLSGWMKSVFRNPM